MVALAHKLPALTLSPAVKLLWSKRALKTTTTKINKEKRKNTKHQSLQCLSWPGLFASIFKNLSRRTFQNNVHALSSELKGRHLTRQPQWAESWVVPSMQEKPQKEANWPEPRRLVSPEPNSAQLRQGIKAIQRVCQVNFASWGKKRRRGRRGRR